MDEPFYKKNIFLMESEDELDNKVKEEEELSLPKATMTKLINENLPPGYTCTKETRDLLTECCVEFIHLLSRFLVNN